MMLNWLFIIFHNLHLLTTILNSENLKLYFIMTPSAVLRILYQLTKKEKERKTENVIKIEV